MYYLKRCLEYLKFGASFVRPLTAKVYLIGTPTHGNMGDSAITIAEIEFIKRFQKKKYFIQEVTIEEYKKFWKIIKILIPKSAQIFLLGGGNMGDIWLDEELLRRHILCNFPQNKICIFPQTITYIAEKQEKQSIMYYNKNNITLAARERKSYEIMSRLYANAEIILTPDIVLSCDFRTLGVQQKKRDKITFCFRHDREKIISDEIIDSLKNALENSGWKIRITDMCIDAKVTKENRRECVKQKMEEFISSKLVITDRLHAMLFSYLTATPCIVFKNSNQKITGTLEWLKRSQNIFFTENMEQAISAIFEILNNKKEYIDNIDMISKFEPLIEYVEKI